jgi:tetratricopeptide (TPR) repeat protein
MPVDVTNHLADGWALFNRTDYTGAEAAFRAATVENPGDVSARIALGFSLIELGRTAEAIQLFSDASSSVQPGSVEQGMNLQGWALALRKLEQFADAETKAKLLVELFPSYAYGSYVLGLIQFDQADFANAASSFRTALEKEPKDIPSADKLVDTLVALKRWDEALLALSDLDRLQKDANHPDRARTLRNWAILLRDAKKLDEAELKATELVTTFENYAPGWNTRALIRQAKGDANGAIEDFQMAVKWGDGQPDRAKWLLNLADALHKAGRNDEAVKSYRELIAIDPNNPATHNSLGIVLEPGDPDAAIVEFEKAVSLWEQSQPDGPDRK